MDNKLIVEEKVPPEIIEEKEGSSDDSDSDSGPDGQEEKTEE